MNWIGIVVLAASVAMFGVLVQFAKRYGDHTGIGTPLALTVVGWFIVAIIACWYSGLRFLVPAILIPILAVTVWIFTKSGKRFLDFTPLHILVGLQAYRVIGVVFIAVHLQDNSVSAEFAWAAGLGDLATGVLAIPVAMMIQRQTPGHRAAFWSWTIVGMGDLIWAPIAAGLYGAKGLFLFPLSLIPMWLGPPLGNVLHLLAINKAIRKEPHPNSPRFR